MTMSLGPAGVPRPPVATFSIVARDPETGALGIAVQSKFLAVGAVVPWARAGVGAIATQAWANPTYGPRGLELLARGLSAEEAVRRLIEADEGRDDRQLGIVDGQGRAFAYTGSRCHPWAGHLVGEGFACQGNILAGEPVVQAMAQAYRETPGDLAARLLAALEAGQREGGDRRGRQSAAILIVREGAGYGGLTDRYMDLRVDDHPEPIQELGRLIGLFRLYFEKEPHPRLLPLEGEVLARVQEALTGLGYLTAPSGSLDEATRSALEAFYGIENFEERIHGAGVIDEVVYRFMLEKAGL